MFKHLYKKKRPRYLAILSLIIATSSYFACGVPQAEYDDVSEKLLEREQAIQGLEAQILEITIVLDETRADLDHSRKTGHSIETKVTELQGDINELTLSHKSQTSKLEFSHLTDLLEREHHISKLNADIHSSIILDIKQKKEIENAQNRSRIDPNDAGHHCQCVKQFWFAKRRDSEDDCFNFSIFRHTIAESASHPTPASF